MKKFVMALLLTVLLGAQTMVQAIEMMYVEDYGCNVAAVGPSDPIAKDPMNNDLFEVVAEIQPGAYMLGFERYWLEYTEDDKKARVIKHILGYDGVLKTEIMTDFMSVREAESLCYDYNGWGEDDDDWMTKYNDGLVVNRRDKTYLPYAFKDINDNYYILVDPAWGGFGIEYSNGLIHEQRTESIYLPDQIFPEWGDTSTQIYTVFSDDVNYMFEKATINAFDDNGYSTMRYGDNQYVVKLKRGLIPTVFYNGEKIHFDQIPVIENGRTLVPLRAIFEKIGAEVEWNGDTQTVTATKGEATISLTIDSAAATKNGETIALDVPAKVINGRTMVPVRFVSECMGVEVAWDDVMQRVSLTSK